MAKFFNGSGIKRNTNWDDPITISYDNNFSVHKKINDDIITTSDIIKETNDYKIVHSIITDLIESGLTKMGQGYCISVSDIIFNQLNQKGIKCHLVEVQMSCEDHQGNKSYMVGFDTVFQQNSHTKVNTHVVVVTDTEIPMLVDMSISHRLPGTNQAVIEKAINKGDRVMCKFEKDGWSYIYQEKRSGIGIPQLHQISILERISTDKKIFKEIKDLKALNLIGICLSIFALVNVLLKVFNVF